MSFIVVNWIMLNDFFQVFSQLSLIFKKKLADANVQWIYWIFTKWTFVTIERAYQATNILYDQKFSCQHILLKFLLSTTTFIGIIILKIPKASNGKSIQRPNVYFLGKQCKFLVNAHNNSVGECPPYGIVSKTK